MVAEEVEDRAGGTVTMATGRAPVSSLRDVAFAAGTGVTEEIAWAGWRSFERGGGVALAWASAWVAPQTPGPSPRIETCPVPRGKLPRRAAASPRQAFEDLPRSARRLHHCPSRSR